MIPTYKLIDFFEGKLKVPEFHINKLEEMPPLPSRIKSPHKHDFMELFIVTDGIVKHNVDFKQFNIDKNNLFFISKGQFHMWVKTIKPLKGYRLMFSESFFDNTFINSNFLFELIYINNIYFTPLITVHEKEQPSLYTLFDLLYKEYKRERLKKQALQANLYLLLVDIQRISMAEQTVAVSHHISIYRQFILLLDSNFHLNKKIDFYSDKLNISAAQLNRIVLKIAHVPIGQVISQRIILEAKRLLVTSSLSINEISYKIGLDDPSYFIRLFKKKEAQTPSEYRNQNKL